MSFNFWYLSFFTVTLLLVLISTKFFGFSEIKVFIVLYGISLGLFVLYMGIDYIRFMIILGFINWMDLLLFNPLFFYDVYFFQFGTTSLIIIAVWGVFYLYLLGKVVSYLRIPIKFGYKAFIVFGIFYILFITILGGGLSNTKNFIYLQLSLNRDFMFILNLIIIGVIVIFGFYIFMKVRKRVGETKTFNIFGRDPISNNIINRIRRALRVARK